jgi:hypothetical protein
VGFEGNQFDGSILLELSKAVDAGIIRVVDLVFVIKDMDGSVTIGEYEDQPAGLKDALASLEVASGEPLFTEDDITKVAAQLEDDTAAAVLVLEHLWAKGLKKAIVNAGGMIIAEGRIHPETAEEAAKELHTTR